MKNFLISLSLSAMLVTASFAAEPKKDTTLTAADKQDMIDNSTFEMPSAGALVHSLTKSLGNIDWNSFIVPVGNKKYTSIEDKVLNLGVRGADAYFLTKSKDSANLIAVSTEINYLLNKIVINNKSLNTTSRKKKLKKVKDLVKMKNWANVQKEINILQNNINTDFIDFKSENLKLLNNVGGWIEGYRLAIEGFNQNYKAAKTEILLQGDLITYLHSELENNKDLTKFSKTQQLLDTLKGVNAVLKKSKDYQLTKAQIVELSKILNSAKQYI